MNRKILFVLLALPLTIFAGETVLDSRIHTNAQFSTTNTSAEALTRPDSLSTEEEKTIVDQIALQTRSKSVDFEQTISPTDHLVPNTTSDWLQAELLEVTRTINPMDFDKTKIFSRCASGYQYRLYQTEAGELEFKGVLYASEGCDTHIIGLFTFDFSNKAINMQFPNELGSTSLQEYLRLYQIFWDEA